LLARVAETLPVPPLSRNQVELMEVDTVAFGGMPGFDAFGIAPRSIEHAPNQILAR
jgi:NADH dehydrogenase